MADTRYIERLTAVAAVAVAAALAFISLLISSEHEIAASVSMVIAQFLLFAASVFGIDYKINQIMSLHKK